MTSSATVTTLRWGIFAIPIITGTKYILYIEYNPSVNQFTFKVGSGDPVTFESKTYGTSDGLPGRAENAHNPWKSLYTYAQTSSASESAFISATFDNVYVNGLLYDDFSTPPLSSLKWNTYEFVREISEGKLHSKSRSSSGYTSSANNVLEFVYPLSINNFQATVALVGYQNPQGLLELAGISGAFYNDGTPGGGHIGDVVGEVLIGGTGLNPVAGWRVYKYIDTLGNNYQALASGTFTTPNYFGECLYFIFRMEWKQVHF